MANNYARHVQSKSTPQTEAIPGKKQVKNSAGGYVFEVSAFDALDRFLILGCEGNTYYATEKEMTKDNAKRVLDAIKLDGVRVVNRIVEISDAGRAPKNDPALFALAMALKLGDEKTREAAKNALPKVARIGTHLFHFAEYIEAFGGWGRGTKRAISNWYNDRSIISLQKQVSKYQTRDGWSHADMIRLAHIKPNSEERNKIFLWTGAKYKAGELDLNGLDYLKAVDAMKKETNVKSAIKLIEKYELPREVIPTEMLNEPKVWEALMPHMGTTAIIRNLAKLTSIGLIAPLSDMSKKVISMITDSERLKKDRIHPIQLLSALRVYQMGRGIKGSLSWIPDQNISMALDEAFYLSFDAVTPTGKNHFLALDVSGSMTCGDIAGVPGLDPRTASAALALVTMNVEKNTFIAGFTDTLTPLKINAKMSLDDVCKYIGRLSFGRTDCSLPMQYATKNKMKVDGFVVYTDSETYAGTPHPSQALELYRKNSGINAKSVVVGMVANNFTIADPNDAGMLDVVGFDTATPNLISGFISK